MKLKHMHKFDVNALLLGQLLWFAPHLYSLITLLVQI